MPTPTLELADIFRQHGPAYRQAHSLPLHHHRAMQAIEACRTPLLGGVVEWGDQCQYSPTRYRSCRNRPCPKCQGLARAKWLEQRKAERLPTEYFHVVFTLPEPIAAIAFYNQDVVYDILFGATAETLLTIAADPQRWSSGSRKFLFPVKVLSARFRRLFLKALTQAHAAGELQFFGDLAPLADPPAFARYLAPLQHKNGWCTPRLPLADRNMSWSISAATPIAWPSPIGASWLWKTAQSPSSGRITATLANPR